MKAKIGAPRLGFGCAAIPGPLTAREALTVLETAYACGIRHFDTARMYCDGQSERVLAELIRKRRDEVVVVTKAGIEPTSRFRRRLNSFAAAFRLSPRAQPGRFEPDRIRRSVETSLRELRTDYVDALLLHEIRALEVTDELKRVLEAMRQEGKIRAVGVATSIEDTEALIAAHGDLCGLVQVAASWLDRPRALPEDSRLVLHSVLVRRLPSFIDRLRADAGLAARFREDTGLTWADTDKIAALMLQAAISRNPDGVTLFSTSRLDRLRHNCDLLTVKFDTPRVRALERALRASQAARSSAAP